MAYTLLIGGARSGKSDLAEQMAARSGKTVVFVATAAAGDDEMAERIRHHRANRPAGWTTVEAPLALAEAVSQQDPEAFLVVDCLTLWVSNLLGAGHADDDVLAAASGLANRLATRPGGAVVVTNEVGTGIVPVNPLARRYRDLLGRVNIATADLAATVRLVVAGRTLDLPGV